MIDVYDFNYNDHSDTDSIISGFNDKTNELIISVTVSIGDDDMDYQTHTLDNETILDYDPDSEPEQQHEQHRVNLDSQPQPSLDDESMITGFPSILATDFGDITNIITDDTKLILSSSSVDRQLSQDPKISVRKQLSKRFNEENLLKLLKFKPIITRCLNQLKNDLKNTNENGNFDDSLNQLTQISKLLIFISNYELGSKVKHASHVYQSDLNYYSKVRHNDPKISYKSSLIQQFLVEIYHYLNNINLNNTDESFINDNNNKLVTLLTSFEKLAVACESWSDSLKLPLPEKKKYDEVKESIKSKMQAKQLANKEKEEAKRKEKKKERTRSSGSVRGGNGGIPIMADMSPVKVLIHNQKGGSVRRSSVSSYEFPTKSSNPSPTASRRGSVVSVNSNSSAIRDSPTKARRPSESGSTISSSSSFLPKLTLSSAGYGDGMMMPNPVISVQFPNYISLIKNRSSSKNDTTTSHTSASTSSSTSSSSSSLASQMNNHPLLRTNTNVSEANTVSTTVTKSTISTVNSVYSFTPASTFPNGHSVLPLDIDNLRNLNKKLIDLHSPPSNVAGSRRRSNLVLNPGQIKVIEKVLSFTNTHLLKFIIIPELIDFLTEYLRGIDSLISKLAGHII